MTRSRLGLLLGAFLLVFPATVHPAAQNKLIAKKFVWKVAETAHFNIHYYTGAEKILPETAEMLERAYASVTRGLGIDIPQRSNFFLFLNHNEFEQNNIVPVGEGTGGVTEAFKDRFLVFNNGSKTWLEHVIVHEFVHVAQFHVLYSGFWKSVRLLKSVLYPLWFMEGMAEHYSDDIDDVERDMVLRDAVSSDQIIPLGMLHGFNHVKPHQVTLSYKTGNAALNFIAREHGADAVGRLLKDISEKFDINSSLDDILGIGLKELDWKLKEDLSEQYEEDLARMKSPLEYGEALTRPDDLYPVFNSNPTFLPDGASFVYLSDSEGTTEVYRHDLALRRSLPLGLQKKYPDKLENIHQQGSGLSVSKDGRWLLFAGERRQKDHLYLYDLKRDRLKILSYPLDSVFSPQFSPDGERIGFIGMKDGVTDVYLSDLRGKSLKALTETPADESDLRFFPDGRNVLFSRETLNPASGHHERDLWTLPVSGGQAKKITNLPGNEIQPAVSSSGRDVLFIGEEGGTRNLYRLSLSETRPRKLTDVIGGNFYPVYSPDDSQILFVSHWKGEQHIYRADAAKLFGASAPAEPAAASRTQRSLRAQTAAAPRPGGEPITFSLSEGKPYRFRASTDFFFPLIYYSSLDGLFASAYWQASEMLGNHQVQASVSYASAISFLNYQVFYSYLRFRPQFFVGFLGDTQDSVFLTTRESRREDAQLFGVSYPLGRFDQVQLQMLTTQRRVQFEDDDFIRYRFAGRENVATLSYSRDVSHGRYLETTRGYRFVAAAEEANAAFDSTLDYRNYFLTYQQFLPVHRESSLAFQWRGGSSFGRDQQVFRAGGSDLLRGYSRFDGGNAANNFVINNIEFRFPIFFNANYHIWFFFPDFLFKNIYGALFMDSGLLWNRRDDLLTQDLGDVRHSLGVGLRFQTFVLQTFPVILRLDFARRTSDGEQTFYFGLGPTF